MLESDEAIKDFYTDEETVDLIYNILQDLNRDEKVSIVMVTHDVERVSKISNRIFCFEDGTLVELDKKQIYIELSHKHKHPHDNNVCSCCIYNNGNGVNNI